jgi:hypothetical protein
VQFKLFQEIQFLLKSKSATVFIKNQKVKIKMKTIIKIKN